MRRHALLYAAWVLAAALVVWAAGAALASPAGRRGVLAGVALGTGLQLLVFAATAAALPGNRLAAFGVGMLARLALVLSAALVLVPATGLPPAPTLLSLVTVLFATTLLEPVLFAAGARDEKGR